jgi:MoaA/NifB/PqqE/SkfB family radical SAM enzyme
MTDLAWKLWIYTNYDCNLSCSYCVAESHPRAERRRLALSQVQRLVDEAVALDFSGLYFTGGEPFLVEELYDMLAYAAPRLPTTVLSNGMLIKGRRLERLRAAAHPNLTIQISLDGGRPEHHDPYRGPGSWAGAVAGVRALLESGFHVRLATTVTAANSAHLDEMCAFHTGLGIPEVDHFTRPLAKRGFSQHGMEVDRTSLLPEITVNADGVYWHPLTTAEDMLVCREIFPLEHAVCLVRDQMASQSSNAELHSVPYSLELPSPQAIQTGSAKPFR